MASQQAIKDNYANFEVPYYGTDNDDYVNGERFCCDNKMLKAGAIGNGNDNPELFQYYYHSDHLGSSSLITNLDGEVVQHVEYVPFGEVFIEERNNTWNTPYLFNAKELDPETSLYYYGARYYDPRISLWLSTDQLQEKYPNISTYAYTFLNPIRYIDPTGMEGGDPQYHTVKSGETLSSISKKYGVSISDLAAWNGINDVNKISAGKELLMNLNAVKLAFETYPDIIFSEGATRLKATVAPNLTGMIVASMQDYNICYLEGPIYAALRNDPALSRFEEKVLNSIKGDIRYGKESFIMLGGDGVLFGGDRWTEANETWSSLDRNNPIFHFSTWKVAANELTWALRHTHVRYLAQVSASGQISIDYRMHDILDLTPSQNQLDAYNYITRVLGFGYHDVLGGNRFMQTRAEWSKTY